MTHIGTAAIMIAFLMIGSQAGSLDFAVLGQGVLSDNVRNVAFITAFAGFALKAGLLPLHVLVCLMRILLHQVMFRR